jgi:hypothetical protein
MIELTKARLEEARSLLSKLLAERSKQVQHATPTASREFWLLLNGFITAARSVRWALQKEETQRYDAWSASWDATLTEDEKEIFRRVTNMRNSIEKEGHPGLVARREWVDIPENPHPVAGLQYSGLPEWGRPRTEIDVYYVEGTNRQVLSICEQYVAILTRMVDDFEKNARP